MFDQMISVCFTDEKKNKLNIKEAIESACGQPQDYRYCKISVTPLLCHLI